MFIDIIECNYTNVCNARGDPHITTFDGTLYHFQGEGFFDYVKSCSNGISLPFTISAKHYQCRSTRTCIEEVIIEFNNNDNTMISFPSYGNNPLFIEYDDGSYIYGDSAIGSYSFTNNNNGEIVSYTISNNRIEITFIDDNNNNAMLKLYYKGKTLEIETTDCLIGDNNLCGLCGNLNNDNSDDFIRCDNGEIIDNSDVSSGWSGTPWENTHIFGESCCNYELDYIFIGESDCGNVTQIPNEINEECLLNGESICEQLYNYHCKKCEYDSDATDDFIESCSFDMCADTECELLILDGINFYDAIDSGCLQTSIDQCAQSRYFDLVEEFSILGYQL